MKNRDCPWDPLDEAVRTLREAGSLEQLPILANRAGQLLGVLRRLGDQQGAAMPRDVVLAIDGLRRWSLSIQDDRCGYEAASVPAQNAD
jgi:hypothetical protein